MTTIHSDLKIVKELICNNLGFDLTNLKLSTEGIKYGAGSFGLDGKTIQFRVSKITPTKTGQFVTIWKRNKDGITQPFDMLDDVDFIAVASRSDNNFGLFVFPKHILVDKGIISRNGQGGKRGIRVYPPWDKTINKQAAQTQSWQTKYFITIDADNATDFSRIKNLFRGQLD